MKLPAGHDAEGCKDSLVAEALCHHSPPVPQAATQCRERGYLEYDTVNSPHLILCNLQPEYFHQTFNLLQLLIKCPTTTVVQTEG